MLRRRLSTILLSILVLISMTPLSAFADQQTADDCEELTVWIGRFDEESDYLCYEKPSVEYDKMQLIISNDGDTESGVSFSDIKYLPYIELLIDLAVGGGQLNRDDSYTLTLEAINDGNTVAKGAAEYSYEPTDPTEWEWTLSPNRIFKTNNEYGKLVWDCCMPLLHDYRVKDYKINPVWSEYHYDIYIDGEYYDRLKYDEDLILGGGYIELAPGPSGEFGDDGSYEPLGDEEGGVCLDLDKAFEQFGSDRMHKVQIKAFYHDLFLGSWTNDLEEMAIIGYFDDAGNAIGGTKDQTYTGSPCTQNPVVYQVESNRVYDDTDFDWMYDNTGTVTRPLKKDRDFTVSYENNTKVGTAAMIIQGTGLYVGTATREFQIIEKEHVWDEGVCTQAPTCTGVGVQTFTCTICGQTRNEVLPATGHNWSEEFTVDKEPTCTTAGSKSIYCKTCSEKKPDSSVVINALGHTYGNWVITKNPTCTKPGSKERTCSVCGNVETEAIPTISHSWDAGEITTPATCVSKGVITYTCTQCGKEMTEESPIDPDNHVHEIMTATVKATTKWAGERDGVACGDCGEILTVPTVIPQIKDIVLTSDTFTYTGKGIEPAVKVEDYDGNTIDASNYKVEYTNNVNVATADAESAPTITVTFKGDYYDGTLTTNFTIQPKAISKWTFPTIAAKTYTGKALTPAITVKDGDVELVKDTDYTVDYSNNTKIGTATVTITGINGYTGSVKKTFAIKGDLSKTATKVSAGSISDKTYSGSALTPASTVKAMGPSGSVVTLKKGTDYKLSYSNNKAVGKATVTITGIGKYTGTKKVTFKINPKGTTISSAKAVSKGFTVKWKKQATQTTGYQIYYTTSSTKPKATTKPKVTISKTGTVSKKVTGLKGGKKYYVYVRTYKTVNGVKYYSAWSKAKTVTTKK